MLKRLLSLALLSFGCASAPVGTPPAGSSADNTGWKLYRTAHLQLATNVSDQDARMGVQAGPLPSMQIAIRRISGAELAKMREELAQGAPGSIATVR